MKTFTVESGQLIISDPCYTVGTWCQGIVSAKTGLWAVLANYDGNRVSQLIAYNIEAATNNTALSQDVLTAPELPFVFGVDSGQLGYFDLEHYRNDASAANLEKEDFGDKWDKKAGDSWYRAICGLTHNDGFSFGVIPFGCCSSSGWGDGSYKTYGVKNNDGNYIALMTSFIEDDYSDDEDFDEDDEDLEEETL